MQDLHRRFPNPDPIADPGFFLSRQAALAAIPIMVVLEEVVPVAAALFSAPKIRGVLTGVARAGNSTGDGILIAPGNHFEILAVAIGGVLRLPWVHTVAACLRGEQTIDTPLPALAPFETRWRYSHIGSELSLEGGFEGFLSRLRPRSRRNYRYFRRRAEAEMGLSFVRDVGQEDAIAAVKQLHGVGLHFIPEKQALLTEAAIRQTMGSFAMGLRLPDGQWLSYLSGWRRDDITYVEFQLNDHRHQAASISTVMRTCLLEYEAARGTSRIIFIGGSTDALGRYCEPSRSLDLLVTRRGLRGHVAKMMAKALSPNGQTATMLKNAPVLPIS